MSGLKRYTQLPQLLDILTTETLTVLSPQSWQDRNDSYFLTKFAERRQLGGVLALCLTKAAATFHHWHVFAPNASGVRIEFDEPAFAAWAANIPSTQLRSVKYVKLDRESIARIRPTDLPFVKRHAFRHEGEVRLIVETPDPLERARRLPFELSMITEIIVSPWLPSALYPSVEKAIRAAAPKTTFRVRETTMLESSLFKSAAENEA